MSEHWTRHLPPDVRHELQELHRIDPGANVRILVYVGLWLVAGAIACQQPAWWLRIFCWLLMGLCLHGLGDFMHMCSHGRVLGHPWGDRLLGFCCGLTVGISCSCYRANHLLHHHYLNTERDPDCLAAIADRRLRRVVYYGFFLVGLPLYSLRLFVTGPINARGWREKFLCLLETVAMLGCYSWLFHLGYHRGLGPLLVNGWLMGLPFAMLIGNIRGLAEHSMLDYGPLPDPLHSTRTTLSTRLLSFFFNNQNFHLEHHLFPSVPWHNLERVHRLLRPYYDETEASVAGSYLQFVRDSFRHGPDVGLRYRPDGSSYSGERFADPSVSKNNDS